MAENDDPTDEIAAAAGVAIHHRSALALIAAVDAVRFVDACERMGILILGAEGFRLRDPYVVPDSWAILDLSGLTDPVEAAAEARRFVADVAKPEHWFHFTV